MGKLTAADRKNMSSSEFLGPDKSFPVPDKSHAIAAERDVGRAVAAGSISAAEGAKIKSEAKSREQELSDHMVAHHKKLMGN